MDHQVINLLKEQNRILDILVKTQTELIAQQRIANAIRFAALSPAEADMVEKMVEVDFETK